MATPIQPTIKIELSQELSDNLRFVKVYGKPARKGEAAKAKTPVDLAIALLSAQLKPLYKKAVETQEERLQSTLEMLISRGKSEKEARDFLGMPNA